MPGHCGREFASRPDHPLASMVFLPPDDIGAHSRQRTAQGG